MNNCCKNWKDCKGGDGRPANCSHNMADLDRNIESAKALRTPTFVYDEITGAKVQLCVCTGCTEIATKEVVMHIRVNENHPPAISTPIALLCDYHAKSLNLWDTFHTKENWKQLCEVFRDIGRQQPKQKYSSFIAQDIGISKKSMPNVTPGSKFTMN